MKKTAALFAAILLTAMLCGCSDNNVSQTLSENVNVSSDSSQNAVSCKDIAEKIISWGDYASLDEVSDDSVLSSIIDVNTPDIEEYSIYHSLISVNLEEIIIIRSSDTKATLEKLEERKNTLIDQLAFYPEQVESAKATKIGSKGDICYLLTNAKAADIEKKLLEILP